MTNPDVTVVGAGIVGAACAFHLAVGGLRVHVVDASIPGGGTTAAGMGHLSLMDDSPAQARLTAWSCQLWNDRVPELPKGVEHDPCGCLWVATDDEDLRVATQKAADYRAYGIDAQILDSTELRKAEPSLRPDLTGALFVPSDAVIYPPVATRWLLEETRRRRGTTSFGQLVLRVGPGEVTLQSDCIATDHVVIAAGFRSLELLPGELAGVQIRPRKGHLAITDRYPDLVRHQIVELGYLKSAHGHADTSVALNIQPRITGQILVGSSRQYGRATDEVEPAVLGRMLSRAVAFMPPLAHCRVLRAWTGFRPATSDNLPLIGAAPNLRSVWLATGHEGLGITTAMATGHLIADLILGRKPGIDPAPYAPNRGSAATP